MFGLRLFNRLGRGTIRVAAFLALLSLCAAEAHGDSITAFEKAAILGSPAIIDFISSAPSKPNPSADDLYGRSIDRWLFTQVGSSANALAVLLDSNSMGGLQSYQRFTFNSASLSNPFDGGPILGDQLRISISHLKGISACTFEAQRRAASAGKASTSAGGQDLTFRDNVHQSQALHPGGGLAMAVVVPLPTAFAMGGFGLIAVAVGSWRRRRSLKRAY